MKRLIFAALVVALSAPLSAHAEVNVTIPKGAVDVDFRQHTCAGAGRIDTGTGRGYSSNVKFRVYWPKKVNHTETSPGGGYSVTRHPGQHNQTRSHIGHKVSGKVMVRAVPNPGYSLAKGDRTVWRFTFKKAKGC